MVLKWEKEQIIKKCIICNKEHLLKQKTCGSNDCMYEVERRKRIKKIYPKYADLEFCPLLEKCKPFKDCTNRKDWRSCDFFKNCAHEKKNQRA